MNGLLQNIDTNSTSYDNDYWEVSITQVRFNYNMPDDTKIIFKIYGQ